MIIIDMGVTNIHHASQVLDRAGHEIADQAVIAHFSKGVLLVGRSFTQDELESFAEAIHTPHHNKWVEYSGTDAPRPVATDKPVLIPTLYTSPGLRSRRGTPQSANGELVEVAFVIVVQGGSGALFSKTRIFYSPFVVAAGIMEEALRGMCVVFSAALLRRDVKKLGRSGFPLVKVTMEKLVVAANEEGPGGEILLCC